MKKYTCDICSKECSPEQIQIDVRRIGVVGSQCNMSEKLEEAQFDICRGCKLKIEKCYSDNREFAEDLFMNKIKSIKGA